MTLAVATTQISTRSFSKFDIAKLQEALRGSVLLPEHPDYRDAISSWTIGFEHQPAIVVLAETAQDIAEAVRFAGAFDLPISVQATGHGTQVANVAGLHINTSRMTGVSIDPERRIARVEAGAKWAHVIPMAHEHGLAPLNGSTSDVGVVGYSLGGGTGWMARKYGFAADRITRIELVTANGEQIVASAETNPDLFWAMRGGGGNFGVVTALEFELLPVADFFGGAIFYPLEAAREVFAAYGEWTATLPDDVTASIGIFRLPPLPFLPEPLQGKAVVRIAAVSLGDEGEALVAPIRNIVTPVMDAFARMPYTMIDLVSSDPIDPMPTVETALNFDEFGPDAVDSLLRVAGAGIDTPVMMIEIRYLRGAGEKAPGRTSAANRSGGNYLLFAAGVAMSPELGAAIRADLNTLRREMTPHSNGAVFYNFLSQGEPEAERTMSAFTLEHYIHLARIKAKFDPENRFRFNRNITPDAATLAHL